jgi:GMP reductase
MAGGMFAGHEESGGENIQIDGEWFKKFYGMSSDVAMDKYSGGVANYKSSEGKLVYLPAKGQVINTVYDLLGGIRSTCTYVGAQSIEELPEKTTFIRVSQQLNEVYGKATKP